MSRSILRILGNYPKRMTERNRWGNLSVIAFHEKAGPSQVDSSLASRNKVFVSRRVAAVAMLSFALSRSDFVRSVHIGRSRFNRCCYLFGALWFCSCRVEPGPGD